MAAFFLTGRHPPLAAAARILERSILTGSLRHGLSSSLMPWNLCAIEIDEIRREMVETLCAPRRCLIPVSVAAWNAKRPGLITDLVFGQDYSISRMASGRDYLSLGQN